MKSNIGNTDRIIRIILAILIFTWGIIYQNWLGILGFIPLTTAFAGWCPLYSLLGISTNSKKSSEKSNF